MPLIQGLPGYVSATSGFTGPSAGGIIGTRLKGPALAGQVSDNVSSGPGPAYLAGGYICVQSTASLVNQILSTADAVLSNRASFVYIPVTTGPLVGSTGPAYQGVGTPLVWNDVAKALMVWSSGSASWMMQVSGTSFAAGAGTFTTS